MSTRLHRHVNLLRTLHKSSPAIRKKLLKLGCNGDFVECITECVKNLLRGNIPLNSAQKKKLAVKKKVLRQIALKKTSLRKKTKTDTERWIYRCVARSHSIGIGQSTQ